MSEDLLTRAHPAMGRVDMAAGMLFHEASVLRVVLNAPCRLRAA